jgi:hypothetical protein
VYADRGRKYLIELYERSSDRADISRPETVYNVATALQRLLDETAELPRDVGADNVRETAASFRAFTTLKRQIPELAWAEINAAALVYLGAVVTLVESPADAPGRSAVRDSASKAASSTYTLSPERLPWTLAARLAKAGTVETPPAATEVVERISEQGFHVRWYFQDDLFLITVSDDAGVIIKIGGGDDPVGAIVDIARSLLPNWP